MSELFDFQINLTLNVEKALKNTNFNILILFMVLDPTVEWNFGNFIKLPWEFCINKH